MDQAAELNFTRARNAAEATAARAELEALRIVREAQLVQIAAYEKDRAAYWSPNVGYLDHRARIMRGLTSLRERRLTDDSPRWEADSDLFDTLGAKVKRASEIATDISAAILAQCTDASPVSSERRSKKYATADGVHASVQPVIYAVGRALRSDKWNEAGSVEDRPRDVEILRAQSYDDLIISPIPDFSATMRHGESTLAHLTGESQVGIVECDKCEEEPSIASGPSVGEARTAGFVAASLFPAITCGADLEDFDTRPLSGYGVYTDSSTSTLVEVCITGLMVKVFCSRMPFLPGGTLPGGTFGADASPTACGAIAFGLGVMAMLGDPRLRASASAAYIQDICPRPEAVALPALASFLGRGKFARVFRLDTIAVKVPLSSLTPIASWNVAIDAEASALMRLGACRPTCCHFPELATLAASGVENTRGDAKTLVAAPFVALREFTGASTILLRGTSGDSAASGDSATESAPPLAVQGLLTTPVCTMLPEAVSDLRRLIPLADRTVPLLQFLSLSIAFPLLAAQAHARSVGLSHCDVRTMNVGLDGWNADAAVAQLNRASYMLQSASRPVTESSAMLRTVDLPALTSSSAMCLRVMLNDWGCARKTDVAGISNKIAVADDTAQVIDLVGHVLRQMLDLLPDDELVDSASEGVAAWWTLTFPRLGHASGELQVLYAERVGDIAPQMCLLRALGLASNLTGATQAGSKRTRDVSMPPHVVFVTDLEDVAAHPDASVKAFCFAAAAATCCSCYSSSSTLGLFPALPTVDDGRLAHRAGVSALPGALVHGAESDVTVLVSNIADFLNERALRAMMAEFGTVVACVVLPPDAVTGASQRALIQYADAAVAARVVAGLPDFKVGRLLLGVAAAPAVLVARHLAAVASEKCSMGSGSSRG